MSEAWAYAPDFFLAQGHQSRNDVRLRMTPVARPVYLNPIGGHNEVQRDP